MHFWFVDVWEGLKRSIIDDLPRLKTVNDSPSAITKTPWSHHHGGVDCGQLQRGPDYGDLCRREIPIFGHLRTDHRQVDIRHENKLLRSDPAHGERGGKQPGRK
jgi:hypothetical protein